MKSCLFSSLPPAAIVCRNRLPLCRKSSDSEARRKKRSTELRFFQIAYSLEPVSMSEPMIIFWNTANRMMTGRTHMTAPAMTGPTFCG